jgi:hypothetical protein
MCHVLSLRETKLALLLDPVSVESIGPRLSPAFDSITDGTRGGLMTAWDPAKYDAVLIDSSRHSISACFTCSLGSPSWVLTNVYGPFDTKAKKEAFLAELSNLRLIDAP